MEEGKEERARDLMAQLLQAQKSCECHTNPRKKNVYGIFLFLSTDWTTKYAARAQPPFINWLGFAPVCIGLSAHFRVGTLFIEADMFLKPKTDTIRNTCTHIFVLFLPREPGRNTLLREGGPM
jgi:hypothetical protein